MATALVFTWLGFFLSLSHKSQRFLFRVFLSWILPSLWYAFRCKSVFHRFPNCLPFWLPHSSRVRALTRFLPCRYALSIEQHRHHERDCLRLRFSYWLSPVFFSHVATEANARDEHLVSESVAWQKLACRFCTRGLVPLRSSGAVPLNLSSP